MSWRGPVSALGTLLLVAGLGGFAFVATAPALPRSVLAPVSAIVEAGNPIRADSISPRTIQLPERAGRLPITRLVIERIELDTEVVPAELVEHEGATTWAVPKFVAGHADGTAGAGERGNAVVLGHVTSLTLGNVFEHLDRVLPGDAIVVYSGEERFDYHAVDVRAVDRTDNDVLEAADTPSLTLITCTGAWLPTVWDYAERLIVRAEASPAKN